MMGRYLICSETRREPACLEVAGKQSSCPRVPDHRRPCRLGLRLLLRVNWAVREGDTCKNVSEGLRFLGPCL